MDANVARLLELIPTQFALGMVQVRSKMAQTRQMPASRQDAFMDKMAIAVVRGPGGRLHVVDHHHWSRAWVDLGFEKAPVNASGMSATVTGSVLTGTCSPRSLYG